MATAADLFYSTDTKRETLHRRITPTDDQFDDQKNRWNDLAGFLRSRLKDDTGLSTRTWLQGSYKFDTQVRPAVTGAQFDIDLGLYFEWKGQPEDGEHEPANLKVLIQSALEAYKDDAENDASGVEQPKERCCRITFKPDFHIDVPAYHLDQDRDARSLATETKGWEESDPKAIYKWFKERYDDAGRRSQLRRQVRYLKMWAALAFEDASRPSSILLTVIAARALAGYAIESVADDDLLEHVAITAHRQLKADATVANPVNANEDLNRLDGTASADFVTKLDELSSIASRARNSGDQATAAEIWTEAFGPFFPMPEDNEELAKVETARNDLVTYRFDPIISVVATPRSNRHRLWQGTNELAPIPKDCEIKFTLINAAQLPVGATLRWTVRNRGDEAARINDLGHAAGQGITITRNSAYNGDHAMDLAVYLGAQVIGRRRISIVVRGVAVPPRNKPRLRWI
jgi:Adenylyl/Guanylyl and SMODS C-terminal sensor domain/Second Messenger Oligonucleotide or Dinucleotide Synthetase domain